MANKVLTQFEQTNDTLWKALANLDQQALNTIPFEGS